MIRSLPVTPVIMIAIGILSLSGLLQSAEPSAGEILYVRRLAPLFHERCLSCHGNDEAKLKGDFDMRSREAMLRGGESASRGFVSGSPEQSPLYLAVTRTHEDWEAMPPKEADKLYEEQVAWIGEWITAGAPWPEEERFQEITRAYEKVWAEEDGIQVATSGGLAPEWTNRRYQPEGLWAYQPIKKPVLEEKGAAAIDRLIADAMPTGLSVAPAAKADILIRRATFDLTGLPPTPEEIQTFVNASAQDADADADAAFAALIDRLLASPHYGERMAQHWLDVVRYADSSGFANDYERGNAWRYRDYVVRAFNEDKPYADFTREQIAGDEIDPEDPEMLIAAGFLRMGPWELTGMEVAKVARQRFLDDVTNSVGETFMAHSLQCARCHDHKFDPVPTSDYYSIQAVFATTQLTERPAAFLPEENLGGFAEKAHLEGRRLEHVATLAELGDVLLRNAEQWYVDQGRDPGAWRAAVEGARSGKSGNAKGKGKGKHRGDDFFNEARSILAKGGVSESDYPPKLVGFTPEQYGRERVARKGLERLAWEMDRYQPFAFSVYGGPTPTMTSVLAPVRMPKQDGPPGELEQTCILTGGDPFSPATPVTPGVLSVLGDIAPIPPATVAGRRLAFADWVASPRNQLSARAIVNRAWMWHFGEPLAGNPNNFGSTGKKPTHPALLDWLAATLIEEGGSLKSLHRMIMQSEAYRRCATHPDPKSLAELDPTGSRLAVFHPRRLSAEELRDAMLSATGEINLSLGGIPNRPEINLEAALQPRQVMGTFANAWVPNPQPKERHRRSLYALKLRGLSDPAMEVFNAPGPDFSCERREISTVTPQVFALFNSQASYSRAIALADRARRESSDDAAALTRCFWLCYGRAPEAAELARCLEHWRTVEQESADVIVSLPSPPLEVLREAVEENTGETFVFAEKLHANADFIPDLRPADCDARTRALAEVCLVLLNSNEFAYVY